MLINQHYYNVILCDIIRLFSKNEKPEFYSSSALLAMQTAVIAIAILSLSVRLSVLLSYSGVLSRRMKIPSCGLQHQVGQSF